MNKNLGVINHIKFSVNISILISLYYSLIFPYIYYCNLIWGATFKTYINVIYLIQKKIFHIILISSNNVNLISISPYFNKFKILTVYELNVFKANLFYHKIIYTNKQISNFCSIENNFNTRSKNSLLLKPNIIPKKTIVTRNIYYYDINQWNALPEYLRLNSNFKNFKSELKNYLNCFS